MKPSRLGLTLLAVALSATVAAGAPQKPSGSASTCVALTVPSVQGVDGNATSFATAVRDLFASYLKGPSIRTLSLEARLPSQAALEARDQDCGQLLLVTVERKRAGGSSVGRILGQATGVAVTRTPLGGGVTGAVATGATWAGGEAIYRFASEIRAKDELELSYLLGAPNTVERAKPVTSKAKAKSDGEDLLTPLVEKASNGIVTAATAGAR
jgi:hypothetical protein